MSVYSLAEEVPHLEDSLGSLLSGAASSCGSEIDYAAQLRKIPGFQTYSHGGSDSTRQERTINSNGDYGAVQSNGSEIVEYAPHHLPGSKAFVRRRGSIGVNTVSALLPMLKDASRKRDLLLQLEFRAVEAHRRLVRLRKCMLQVAVSGELRSSDDSTDIGELRLQWKSQLKSMKTICDDVSREESSVEELQQQVAQLQWEIKGCEEELFASLTGGTRPSDSEPSIEDHLMNRVNASTPPPSYSSQDLVDPGVLDTPKPRPPAMQALSTTAAETQTAPHEGLNSTPRRPMSPLDQVREPQGRRRSDTKAVSSLRLNVPHAIAFCGSCFPEDDLYLQQARSRKLFVVKEIVEIRKRDLRTALGFDLTEIDASLTLSQKLKEEVAAGVPQKLTNIDVPTVHTKQFISLWGREMSQNAALESYRMFLYGGKNFQELIKQGKIDPLVKLVQDVRSLQVPFTPNDYSEQPLITVVDTFNTSADTYSVEAQPSGKSATGDLDVS